MIDHQSEWNGGYSPANDGHPLSSQIGPQPLTPSLPLGNNPISKSTQKISKEIIKESYELTNNSEHTQTKSPKSCNCLIRELMAYGCKCGGK